MFYHGKFSLNSFRPKLRLMLVQAHTHTHKIFLGRMIDTHTKLDSYVSWHLHNTETYITVGVNTIEFIHCPPL